MYMYVCVCYAYMYAYVEISMSELNLRSLFDYELFVCRALNVQYL